MPLTQRNAVSAVPVKSKATKIFNRALPRAHSSNGAAELRPLFAFFQALTVPTAVYATASDCTADLLPDPGLQDRIRRAAGELVRAATQLAETQTAVTV